MFQVEKDEDEETITTQSSHVKVNIIKFLKIIKSLILIKIFVILIFII